MFSLGSRSFRKGCRFDEIEQVLLVRSVVLNEFKDEFEQKCTDCPPTMSKFMKP